MDSEQEGLKRSNQRLVQLLATTPEYADQFRPMGTAVGDDGLYVFVPGTETLAPATRPSRSMIGDILETDKRRDPPDALAGDYALLRKRESDYWIPCEVFRLMHQFLARLTAAPLLCWPLVRIGLATNVRHLRLISRSKFLLSCPLDAADSHRVADAKRARMTKCRMAGMDMM